MFMRVYIHEFAGACAIGDVRYFPQSLSTFLYEVGSVTEPEILQFSSTGWPASPKAPPLPHLSSFEI